MMLWQEQWVEWRHLAPPHTPSGSQACLCPHNLCLGVGQLSTIQQDQPGCPAKAGWLSCPRLEIAYFSRGSPVR